VAQCRLPFSFNVLAKLPLDFRQRLLATQGRKRRADFDQAEGSPPAPEPPLVPSLVDDANVLSQSDPPSSGQIHHPALVMDQQDSLMSVQSSENSLSSLPPPVLRLQPSQNAGPILNPLPTRQSTMQALRTDGEPTPTLTEVNPESGSVTGGARIWLKGIDFPALFPLFARFGTTVVPTVSRIGLRFGPHLQLNPSDFLCQQPACLSFTLCNRARCRRCYAIETSPTRCTRVWDQYREVSLLRRL